MAKKSNLKKDGPDESSAPAGSGNGAAEPEEQLRAPDRAEADRPASEEARGQEQEGAALAPAKGSVQAELERRLEELERELEELRQQADEYRDRLLRSQAELQNVLKRHERDRAERARYAVEPLARDLLPVVDDLERALAHAGEGSRSVAEGVELVLKSLLGVLERHGIERIHALGAQFDPKEHEAVQMVETADREPNTVIEEHRPGYRMHDRLLRPAMVAVARPPAGSSAGDGAGGEPSEGEAREPGE
ncbi:MAG: nucleotide exchange factor GrpE [Candidatus Dadabacteria bacterium]|nr:MAG: nucleotide exchange factor GrpE [Candidatus Dadabacteria bacterium]